MIQRTTNFGHRSFPDYGGAGIGVHPSFVGPGGFTRFLEAVGPRPSKAHTLDRIDGTKGYEPGNLRWATKRRQEANKVRPAYFGRTTEEWARLLGVRPTTIRKRRQRKMDSERAFPRHLRLPPE